MNSTSLLKSLLLRYSPSRFIKTFIFKRNLKQIFRNKSVAVVGSASCLFNSTFGKEIDAHDLVVRFNLFNPIGMEENYGSRTDVRFIGCTLLQKHIPFLEKLETNSIVLTTTKNLDFLKNFKFKVYFYDRYEPWRAFELLNNLLDSPFDALRISKPPRTGTVFLSQLLACGVSEKISTFGISSTYEDSVVFTSFSDGKIKKYDMDKLSENHCDLGLEALAIRMLAEKKLVILN